MKRIVWITAGAGMCAAALWAAMQMATTQANAISLLPDGALLSIESRDFHGLLKDWNDSAEKREWLKGNNYDAFSRSRLFERLGQAQGEFSTAATISADADLLASVAGGRSALAIYDIGNLEFVYVTRMDDAHVQATPLWQVRDKFEQRKEGAATFFVREDKQSNRTAAFAARDGWLVLGTGEGLVAGVLDRIAGVPSHSLPDEPWYSDAVKQAAGKADDLRMALNLEKIVPSPYFRSYWVQRNVTEMKQYRAALCDLHRTAKEFREDRVLLRKPGAAAAATGDVEKLLALAPDTAVFRSAQATGDPDRALAALKENLLEMKSEQGRAVWSAPAAPSADNAGAAADLETRIDVAPAMVAETDPYQPLRTLLGSAQLTGMLEAYATRDVKDEMFVGIDRAMVLEASTPWIEAAVESAMAAALRPGLTASQLGLGWQARSGAAGSYAALDGKIPLYLAVREGRLFVSNSEALLVQHLAGRGTPAGANANGVTYAAVFQHSPAEQRTFRKLFRRLDAAGHAAGANAEDGEGQRPPFFSGNVASLSHMFQNVRRERMEERDQGEKVTQSVVYEWAQK
jgi:hypothetical protein